MKAYHNLGLFLLRFGLATVFIVFGFGKLQNPTSWLVFMPLPISHLVSQVDGLTVYLFLWFLGILEWLLGIHLLFGFLTRWVSLICAFLIASIIYMTLGFDAVGIRDMGLIFTSLAVFFLGAGEWSIDSWLSRQNRDLSLESIQENNHE